MFEKWGYRNQVCSILIDSNKLCNISFHCVETTEIYNHTFLTIISWKQRFHIIRDQSADFTNYFQWEWHSVKVSLFFLYSYFSWNQRWYIRSLKKFKIQSLHMVFLKLLIHYLWFHEKSEYKKNSETFTLCHSHWK